MFSKGVEDRTDLKNSSDAFLFKYTIESACQSESSFAELFPNANNGAEEQI